MKVKQLIKILSAQDTNATVAIAMQEFSIKDNPAIVHVQKVYRSVCFKPKTVVVWGYGITDLMMLFQR